MRHARPRTTSRATTGSRWTLGRAVLSVLTVASFCLAAGPAGAGPSTGSRSIGSPTQAAGGSDPVTVSVDTVTPVAPKRSATPAALTITLTLTNTTDSALTGVQVTGDRGYPITSAEALSAALASTARLDDNDVPIPPITPVTTNLPADGSLQVTFRTRTSVIEGKGLCLCADAVYPLVFTARTAASGQFLGQAVTHVPVSYKPVVPLSVSWVWSLLDRPHRILSDTRFEDDSLAAEVSSGGRLDRALSVVEQVSPDVPMTLVMDPETLDELQVMATTTYRVATASGSVIGTGKAVAAAWLQRLRAILSARSADTLALTPLGDPDIQSVLSHGMTWSSTLPSDIAARVAAAVTGIEPRRDIAWPASGRLDSSALSSISHAGVNTVLLDDTAVRTSALTEQTGSGPVTLQAGGRRLVAPLLGSVLQADVAHATTVTGAAASVLPTLLSQLAIPVIGSPSTVHSAVLTSPRYVDASVDDAVSVIDATSESSYTRPVSLTALSGAPYLPSSVSTLARTTRPPGIPIGIFSAMTQVKNSASTVHSMLAIPNATTAEQAAAAKVLTALPVALDRLESSAWRLGADDSTLGQAYAEHLVEFVSAIVSGVHIIVPATGAYTLGSSNSPLPITVTNTLSLPVYVDVRVETIAGIPGFSAREVAVTIEADSTRTVQLQTSVQRSGRIQVAASLSSPNGTTLGDPVALTVHSTALGTIGVIITVVAGVLLALALVVRFARAYRRRRRARSVGPTASRVTA